MTDTASRVSSQYLTTLRVASRHIARGADGKVVGKDVRLTWNDHAFFLEELPQKGKKKLKQATFRHDFYIAHHDYFMPQNILSSAKISTSDDFKDMKSKIEKAWDKALDNAKDEKAQKRYGVVPAWLSQAKWYEGEEFYLNVVPEGVDPFTAIGKDFTVTVKWTEFSAYSPASDFQQADPHYSYYAQSSSVGARKLYQILKADPEALKSTPWAKFDEWLTKNKVPYKMHHSTWS